MSRYQLWNKTDKLYPPAVGAGGRGSYEPEEYISSHAPWAGNPAAKVVITTGVINCAAFMEFEATKAFIKRQVLERMESDADFPAEHHWSDDFTDRQVLDLMEWLEDNPPTPPPTAEERMAAALEFQNLISM